MKKYVRLFALILLTVFLFTLLPGCQNTDQPANPTDTPTVHISVLSGTTGFGMAQWMREAKNQSLPYEFSVENDASLILSALINGSVDIAALPTNAAAVVYNKTGGKVQVLALNTRGVLYLVANGTEISTFADLVGKTVAVPAQNPTYIFTYLCQKNGYSVATEGSGESADIYIDNHYTTPAELQANTAAGNVALAVLPEPLLTVALSANPALTTVLNLTEEWNRATNADTLVQGCLVVRTEFAKAYPKTVAAFLEGYKASIQFTVEHPQEAAAMIAEAGVFASQAVAQKAIPHCNLCYIDGDEMKTTLNAFLGAMYEVLPASIGGSVPSDDFYYRVQK